MLKVVDNVSPVIPCPSCGGHGGFVDQQGNAEECGDCNGSGEVNVDDLLAEVKRLRPVVEVATEWHTTREALAKADEMSGSEWFIQIGVAMREHQQAADKLAAAVVGVLGVLAGEVER